MVEFTMATEAEGAGVAPGEKVQTQWAPGTEGEGKGTGTSGSGGKTVEVKQEP